MKLNKDNERRHREMMSRIKNGAGLVAMLASAASMTMLSGCSDKERIGEKDGIGKMVPAAERPEVSGLLIDYPEDHPVF